MRYLIQFAAGTRRLVIEALTQTLSDVVLVHEDDSAVVVESPVRIASADRLPFASNVFVVLASVQRRSIPRSIRQLVAKVERVDFPPARGRETGFRIMAQIDGELTPIDRAVRAELEREIAALTQSHVQPKGSCREYWIVGRKNLEDLMFCLRLPKSQRRKVAKGALSHELSTLLVLASRPHKDDVFLDPFAGAGALVAARHESPFQAIIYSDTSLRSFTGALPRNLRTDRNVRLLAEDALRLPSIGDGEIDVIVTDPPWGEFEKLTMDYEAFTSEMASSFDRVLNPTTGRFVILSSRRQSGVLTQSLAACGFKIHATYGILVNGHPASVIVGSR